MNITRDAGNGGLREWRPDTEAEIIFSINTVENVDPISYQAGSKCMWEQEPI